MESIDNIKKYGKDSPGKKYLLKYSEGQILTMKQAIVAHCFLCCGYYADGKNDCLIPSCSLYPFMPYRAEKKKVKKERSEKQVEAGRKLGFLRSTAHRNYEKKQDEAPQLY